VIARELGAISFFLVNQKAKETSEAVIEKRLPSFQNQSSVL
jgi:hypothetical protein